MTAIHCHPQRCALALIYGCFGLPIYLVGNYIMFSEYFPEHCNITLESQQNFHTGWAALLLSMLITPGVMFVFALAEQLFRRLKLNPKYLLATTLLDLPLLFCLLLIATVEFAWAGCLAGVNKSSVVFWLLIGDWFMTVFCCTASLSLGIAYLRAHMDPFSADYQPIILNT